MKIIESPPWVDLLKAYLDPGLTDQERAASKAIWNFNTSAIQEAIGERRCMTDLN